MTSRFAAPACVHNLYSMFPLVVLEQEDQVGWKKEAKNSDAECSLWVHRPAPTSHPYYRPWASSDPESLRAQLLFLLRKVPVSFRTWENEQSAPGSRLPTLHLLSEEKLVPSDQVRAWLDQKHPLKGKNKELQNMPSQEAYDKGVALAQLVFTLQTAYLSETSRLPPSSLSNPPPLAAGLKTPLPAAFTGDARSIDKEDLAEKGAEALEVISTQIQEWALGASQPTPLDALIAANLYPLYTLTSSELRRRLDTIPELGDYLDRVLTIAGAGVRA